MLVQNNKGFQFVRRKNEMSLIGRLDISVIFTKTVFRVLRIGKSTTWSQRYRILTALCFDARLLWHWRSTICRDKFKPFERTFISLLLCFYNSALMQRKKEKEKSISHEVKDESENQQQTQQPLRFEASLFWWQASVSYTCTSPHPMEVAMLILSQTILWVLMINKKYFRCICRLSLA